MDQDNLVDKYDMFIKVQTSNKLGVDTHEYIEKTKDIPINDELEIIELCVDGDDKSIKRAKKLYKKL